MRKQYRNFSNELKSVATFNTIDAMMNSYDSIIRENSNEQDFERYTKRVKSYDELVSYVTSNVTALDFYYNVTFKKMSNNSLSVKTHNNKRICRIDSAYDKVRITSDRVDVLRNTHESFEERRDASFHHYSVIKFNASEFAEVFQKIIENAKAMNLLTA